MWNCLFVTCGSLQAGLLQVCVLPVCFVTCGSLQAVTKGQNNHTLNSNNKHTVEDMCRLIGLSDTVPHLVAGSNVMR